MASVTNLRHGLIICQKQIKKRNYANALALTANGMEMSRKEKKEDYHFSLRMSVQSGSNSKFKSETMRMRGRGRGRVREDGRVPINQIGWGKSHTLLFPLLVQLLLCH